ncbi:MAG: hypothetical protein HYZ42_10890 [Bacteroidetes bacterium]|nr:hypothetical protein [Bacteroidota bacterium]
MKIATILVLFLIFSNQLRSQGLDLGELFHKKSKYIKLTGGLASNLAFNQSNDAHIVRQPFTYMFSGNLNLQVMSWTIPMNFAYTNQKLSYGYQNPFKINRTSINPKYKWLTLHLGDNSMSLSPYTLNGLLYTGGGFDISPTKIKLKVSALYGRFMKATADSVALPTYKRMGWGLKSEYTYKRNKFSLSLFHARDILVGNNFQYETRNVTPQENLCLTFATQSSINKYMDLNIEYSTSILTRDTRNNSPTSTHHPLSIFIPRNITTLYYNAYKTSLNINTKKRKITLGFEHIDPNYRTLGALYFNNDFENITSSITQSFFKNRLSTTLTAGLQRDNLDDKKLRSSKRIVGSFAFSLNASKWLNFAGTYSSFQTYSAMNSQFDRINQPNIPVVIDTLTYTQLSNNASLNTMFKLVQNKKQSQSLNLNLVWQKASNAENGFVNQHSGNQMINSNLAYNIQLLKSGLSIATSVNSGLQKQKNRLEYFYEYSLQ